MSVITIVSAPAFARVRLVSSVAASEAAPAITPPLPATAPAMSVLVPRAFSAKLPAVTDTPSARLATLDVWSVALATLDPAAMMPAAIPELFATCAVSASEAIRAAFATVSALPPPTRV